MTRPIHRSATKEQQILIEEARDEEYAAGLQRGISLVAEWLETAKQNKALADELRSAQIVERTEG